MSETQATASSLWKDYLFVALRSYVHLEHGSFTLEAHFDHQCVGTFPLEAHFVHQLDDVALHGTYRRLAVIGLAYELGECINPLTISVSIAASGNWEVDSLGSATKVTP